MKCGLCGVEIQLLEAIDDRDGEIRSLLALSTELGIDWRNAHRCIKRLNELGHVQVSRVPGHPMLITRARSYKR